jgi:hypothetical protein
MLAWSRGTPRQTIWGELAHVVTDGRRSRLVERLVPKTVLDWLGIGHGGAVVAAAAAAALVVALVRRPHSVRGTVRRHPRLAAAGAVAVAALVAAAVWLATLPIGLTTTITGSRSIVLPNSEVDFIVTLANTVHSPFDQLKLVVDLPRGVELLGPPAYDRGSGCTGTTTIVCHPGYLAPGATASVRFGTKITLDAVPAVRIRAWGVSEKLVGAKASFLVTVNQG